MKTSVKHFISLIALLLSMVMLLSACGGSEDASSTGGDGSETASVTDTVSDQTESKPEDTASKTESTGGKTSSKKQQTTTAKKTTWDANYVETIPDAVVSKGLHVLMWREYTPMEKKLVQDTLAACMGNISAAAAKLGITRQALYRRIEKYGVKI